MFRQPSEEEEDKSWFLRWRGPIVEDVSESPSPLKDLLAEHADERESIQLSERLTARLDRRIGQLARDYVPELGPLALAGLLIAGLGAASISGGVALAALPFIAPRIYEKVIDRDHVLVELAQSGADAIARARTVEEATVYRQGFIDRLDREIGKRRPDWSVDPHLMVADDDAPERRRRGPREAIERLGTQMGAGIAEAVDEIGEIIREGESLGGAWADIKEEWREAGEGFDVELDEKALEKARLMSGLSDLEAPYERAPEDAQTIEGPGRDAHEHDFDPYDISRR